MTISKKRYEALVARADDAEARALKWREAAEGLDRELKRLEGRVGSLVRILPDNHIHPTGEYHTIAVQFSTTEMRYMDFAKAICDQIAQDLAARIRVKLMEYVVDQKRPFYKGIEVKRPGICPPYSSTGDLAPDAGCR